MGITQFGVCKPLAASNPMFGVKRLSLNRELNHDCRVDAQHQIGLATELLLRPGSVRINATLNLGETLLMAMNHANDCDRATHQDCTDWHEQCAQTGDRVNQSVQAASRLPLEISGGADRDRTGGLLVANQALSQLSYSPVPQSFKVARFHSSQSERL